MAEISVILAGTSYTGWEALRIERTLDSLCGSFYFSLYDFPYEDTLQIQPGTSAVIKSGTQELITGYIDSVRRSKNGMQTRLEFTGRDKTSDLVDCSAIYKSNRWKKSTLFAIAADLCAPFGINVVLAGVSDPKIDEFAIQTGESPFEAIERLCRAEGILPSTNTSGELLLTSVGTDTADTSLIVGDNILDITYELDTSGRYSEYLFKGQSRGAGSGWLTDKINLRGTSEDSEIDRYRPLLVVVERKTSSAAIAKRAAWEAQVRAGRGERTQVVLRGWEQTQSIIPGGSRLWTINELVSLKDQTWRIDAQLLITAVTFELSESSGRLTTLDLRPPEIYKADPAEKIQLSRRSRVTPA